MLLLCFFFTVNEHANICIAGLYRQNGYATDYRIPLACVSTFCFLDPLPDFFADEAPLNFRYFTLEEICFFGAEKDKSLLLATNL